MVKYIRSKNVYSSELDGEICIFESTNAEYLTLNETSTYIWKLISVPSSLNLIISKLRQTYEVNENTIFQDVEDFLNKGVDAGVIEYIG